MKTIFPILATTLSCALISCDSSSSTVADVSEGKKLVMESIEAHGGDDQWYANGNLHFRWIYHMTDKGPEMVVDSVQTVNTKSHHAVHTVPDSEVKFGQMDGNYWIHPADGEFPIPTRFWTLTPYYFLGIPFVFNDPNAMFEKLDETIEFEGKNYTQVKVTYKSDSGDSPDDWFVLLIDPETKLIRGTYYIVTHPLVAPDGPGPAKLITLDNLEEIDGVKIATGHRTFTMEDGKIDDQMRYTEIKDLKFIPDDEISYDIPEGAKEL